MDWYATIIPHLCRIALVRFRYLLWHIVACALMCVCFYKDKRPWQVCTIGLAGIFICLRGLSTVKTLRGWYHLELSLTSSVLALAINPLEKLLYACPQQFLSSSTENNCSLPGSSPLCIMAKLMGKMEAHSIHRKITVPNFFTSKIILAFLLSENAFLVLIFIFRLIAWGIVSISKMREDELIDDITLNFFP